MYKMTVEEASVRRLGQIEVVHGGPGRGLWSSLRVSAGFDGGSGADLLEPLGDLGGALSFGEGVDAVPARPSGRASRWTSDLRGT